MRLRNDAKNITSGNLFVGIIRFAMPLFLATLVQNLFTAVDTAVVGNFADGLAVASIGACANIIGLLLNTFIAIGNGAGIIVARAIGARDIPKIKKTVDTSLILSLTLGLLILTSAQILAVPLLRQMECPEECFESAVLYLRVYMLGAPVVMIYNFSAAIIRAEGDSQRPLYYVIISGIVNVVTNIILCLILPNKVAAVAIATVLSQVVSATLSMTRLMTKKDGICHFSLKNLTFRWAELKEIFHYGIPMALTTCVFPLSHLQIQTAINSYGSACLAGITAANSIDNFTSALQSSFNTSCVTFVSQNVGAGNKKRATRSILICGTCAVSSGIILGLSSCYLFSEPLLSIFLPGNAEAIAYGQLKMQYTTAFFWMTATFGCLNASTQAFGYPSFSTFNNLVTVLGFRIIWMTFIYAPAPSIEMLLLCYPSSWGLSALIGIGFFIYAYTQHWKKHPPVAEAIPAKS